MLYQINCVMTYTMYMLAEHPDVMKKLRAEILEQVGGRSPTVDDIKASIHGGK